MSSETKLQQLERELNKPGINPALKFFFNGASSSLPLIGGFVSASLTHAADEELEEFHTRLIEWAKDAEERIDVLLQQIQLLTPIQPSKATLALLLGELFGNKISNELISRAPSEIHVILHPSSLNDMEPYLSKKWVSIIPTHSSVSMGCDNQMGHYIEELKRPYGIGNSFILRVEKIFDC